MRFQSIEMIIAMSLATSLLADANSARADDLRVMSFNIRYASANDGPNSWPNRKEFLIDTIRAFAPDLLGTQETLAVQRDALAAALPDHEVLAAGRDDGADKGEMMAVYFRKSRFEKIGIGHFWLSETPDSIGSKSWDSSLPRMVTWVKLKDRKAPDAKPIAFFNTHFDHRGPKARLESARLIRKKIDELATGCRVIVTGDFNTGEGSDPYRELFALRDDSAPFLLDTYREKNPQKSDMEGTYSGFRADALGGARIDWIGCSPDFRIEAAAIDRTSRDGRTPSDHFPITAVLAFPQNQAAAKKLKLRVLSYNIHHGRGLDDKVDLERIAKVIRDAKPDLVALQEVDRGTSRTARADQTAELAQLTGLKGEFGKAIDYAGGDYGQAILAKGPITDTKIHWLPGEPDRERRIAFEATVTIGGREIRFITTHLHHANDAFRRQQAERINEIYTRDSKLTILAGDLNANPDSEPLKIFRRLWTVANDADGLASYPAETPVKLIDYVLFKPSSGVKVIEQRVIDEPMASDHRPVLVELEIGTK